MILKIKREVDGQEWWILDDIRKISVSRMKRVENTANGIIIDSDIFLLDNATMIIGKQHVDDECGLPGNFPCRELICRTSKGDEFSVAFDTLAYLCNDEGKTIEKIVGS